jgi:hypothetical protein
MDATVEPTGNIDLPLLTDSDAVIARPKSLDIRAAI